MNRGRLALLREAAERLGQSADALEVLGRQLAVRVPDPAPEETLLLVCPREVHSCAQNRIPRLENARSTRARDHTRDPRSARRFGPTTQTISTGASGSRSACRPGRSRRPGSTLVAAR